MEDLFEYTKSKTPSALNLEELSREISENPPCLISRKSRFASWEQTPPITSSFQHVIPSFYEGFFREKRGAYIGIVYN